MIIVTAMQRVSPPAYFGIRVREFIPPSASCHLFQITAQAFKRETRRLFFMTEEEEEIRGINKEKGGGRSDASRRAGYSKHQLFG